MIMILKKVTGSTLVEKHKFILKPKIYRIWYYLLKDFQKKKMHKTKEPINQDRAELLKLILAAKLAGGHPTKIQKLQQALDTKHPEKQT